MTMKVSQLIQKLQRIQWNEGDVDVVIDFDDNGYYDLEAVETRHEAELGDMIINLKSSNEA